MKHYSFFARILVCMILLAALSFPASAQQKYAVLISAGNTTADDAMYHSEYWYDLFLMYRMLIERGFTHDRIFVLYGNGNDFVSAHAAYQTAAVFPGLVRIADFSNTEANCNNIFTWLGAGNPAQGVPQIQSGDFLYYWWMGHGSWDGDDASGNHLYHALIQNTGEQVTDAEFSVMFQHLPACLIKTMFVMTCHSGALFDAIPGLHYTAHTAARYDQVSHSAVFDRPHADFSYYAANALREVTPTGVAVAADTDVDGRLTIREANVYAHAQTTSSETVVFDFRSIAPRVALEDALPAATVPAQGIYSRDYAEDDGTEPSDTSHIWYEGPDLWVRHINDGITAPQNAEFGQTNSIYARVHNLGCATVNATAGLSWSEQSTWNNPFLWNPIASVPVNNLLSGESRVVHQPWSSVPLPGKYCLHTVLNAPGDPVKPVGESYLDNNQVQLNIDVKDTVWEWTKSSYFWIENGIREAIDVDLTITIPHVPGLPNPPKIQLIIPAELKFAEVTGAEIQRRGRNIVIQIQSLENKVVVRRIKLGPLEKREAVLQVSLPEGTKIGATAKIKVVETWKEKPVGGILFCIRAATVNQVIGVAVQRMENLLRMFANMSQSKASKRMSEICLKNLQIIPEDRTKFIGFLRELVREEPNLRRDFTKALLRRDSEMLKALQILIGAAKEGDPGVFVAAQEAISHASMPFFRRFIKKQ
ncbi:MAG: hypothetical protein E4H23_01470 [Chrysiogenales bacterium]|nr:MAG: hypothetical protein E4H23_01470 [Chrysiogenales bacterium]